MKLLVTGCHGFVGGTMGRLAGDLRGHELVGIGRRPAPPEDWPGSYFKLDLAGPGLVEILEEVEPDVLFHAAGPASVPASLERPLDDFRTSVVTWATTLEAVRCSSGRPLLVFPSSAAVYGDPQTLPVGEEASLSPISPYGFHKVACELLSSASAACFGLDVLSLRCFSLFGPRLRRLLVWELYEQLSGPAETVWLQGSGTASRDYLSIGDLEEAFAKLLERRSSFTGHVVLNVASGVATQVSELAEELNRLVAPEKTVRARGEPRPGDPLHWCADLTRLRELVPEWHPRPFSAALQECVDTWQEEPAHAEAAG